MMVTVTLGPQDHDSYLPQPCCFTDNDFLVCNDVTYKQKEIVIRYERQRFRRISF